MNGESIDIPMPVTREEMYLAKMCGMDVELPTPVTLDEMYLYALNGGQIDLPAPVTEKQKIWAKITSGIESDVVPANEEDEAWSKFANTPVTVKIYGYKGKTVLIDGADTKTLTAINSSSTNYIGAVEVQLSKGVHTFKDQYKTSYPVKTVNVIRPGSVIVAYPVGSAYQGTPRTPIYNQTNSGTAQVYIGLPADRLNKVSRVSFANFKVGAQFINNTGSEILHFEYRVGATIKYGTTTMASLAASTSTKSFINDNKYFATGTTNGTLFIIKSSDVDFPDSAAAVSVDVTGVVSTSGINPTMYRNTMVGPLLSGFMYIR